MTNLAANVELRHSWFHRGGDHDAQGQTYNQAFDHPRDSLEQCLGFVPAPSTGLQATIVNVAGGSFPATLDQLDFIIGIMSGTALQAEPSVNYKGIWSALTGAIRALESVEHSGQYWSSLIDIADVTTSEPGVSGDWITISANTYCVSMGSQTNIDLTTITSAVSGVTPIVCTGATTRSGLDYKFLGNFIPGGVTVDIDTTGDDIFSNGGQLIVPAAGIGFRDVSPDTVVHISNHNLIDFIGDGGTAAVLGGANSVKEFNFNSIIPRDGVVGTSGIKGLGAGNETLIIRGGRLVVDTGALEVPDGADWTANFACLIGDIDVQDGGELHTNVTKYTGDINVAAGASFYPNITRHISGSVNNLGLTEGRIGQDLYGGWRHDDEQARTFSSVASIRSSWISHGQFDIDTTTDTIHTISAKYIQTSASSRQVDFQILDAGDGTIYYQGSNIQALAQPVQFAVSTTTVNDLPENQVVNLIIQFKRTGASGVNSPGTIVEFTRTP